MAKKSIAIKHTTEQEHEFTSEHIVDMIDRHDFASDKAKTSFITELFHALVTTLDHDDAEKILKDIANARGHALVDEDDHKENVRRAKLHEKAEMKDAKAKEKAAGKAKPAKNDEDESEDEDNE